MNDVAIRINEKLECPCPPFFDHCIFIVPKPIRMINKSAYEPQAISIGPYHHGKQQLKAMEPHKIRYLQRFLQRAEMEVSELVQSIEELEANARNCYAEPVAYNKDKFIEMMILDGCFIVEFICNYGGGINWALDPILQVERMRVEVMMDLMLIENQIPFFVLLKLFGMIVNENQVPDKEKFIVELILGVFQMYLPGEGDQAEDRKIEKIKHLLELIHDSWQPSPGRMKNYSETRKDDDDDDHDDETMFGGCITKLKNYLKIEKDDDDQMIFARSVTELREAGVTFRKAKRQNLFDISFKNGVIKIPPLSIDDYTERIMRNLIAYEQLTRGGGPKYISDYMAFLDTLINSEKDVETLCRRGIINNFLGDNETVATLFNRIVDNIFTEEKLYFDIQQGLKKHCDKPWNENKASLRHDYCNSPWSLLSVAAAIFLLVLTFLQTLYSLLSYYKT